ncbi:hypothetical protein ACHHYP_06239 [Achlya hypogyna]|uniref:Uncharacterized protein n=1 Tax=Achlya hypogyna TaxID=1202772 RepID=A0A1V9YUQ3_ACHHY|nr:hypothetical protein ACHHYP_06239 [Achlya hypogyna]
MRLAFFRKDCARPRVFKAAYLRYAVNGGHASQLRRCQQSRGLKVHPSHLRISPRLRCFPHCDAKCCPHSDYRNCGTSVSVRLVNDDVLVDVVAYARFESLSNDAVLERTVRHASLTSDTRSHAAPRATWLRGMLDRSDGVLAFHFNATRTDGWHYEWTGGASIQKRVEKHVLQVHSPRLAALPARS